MEEKNYENLVKVVYKDRFEMFRSILLEYNEKFNLTSVVDEEGIFYKHFMDSIVGEKFFPRSSLVAEIGSGGGFPSIPLKIIRDDLRFTLIESTSKKCNYLCDVVKRLEFKNVHVLNGRAEEFGKGNLRERFDCATARAVARLNILCEYCLPLVKVGGRFIAYKGNCDEELKEAQNAIKILGGRLESAEKFTLNGEERTIVVIKKIECTPAKYPRGQGKERKSPII